VNLFSFHGGENFALLGDRRRDARNSALWDEGQRGKKYLPPTGGSVWGPVDPKGFKEVPKTEIPAAALKVGTPLSARSSEGEDVIIRVHEVKQKTVILDFNHPLAGKTLNFDVKVIDIEPKEA
jgi:FKBP-type peptidyl-prolyl cis-trans isomerase 2